MPGNFVQNGCTIHLEQKFIAGRAAMTVFYYMRVSTKRQSLSAQQEAAKALGIPKANWYCDKSTGTNTKRPKFEELMAKVQPNDAIYVHSFDRLSRSTKDLLNTIEYLKAHDVKLISERENLDTATPTGKLIVSVIAAISQFEVEIMKERQAEGIAARKASGLKCGGRKPIPKGVLDAAVSEYQKKQKPCSIICKELGISRTSLYNELNKRGIKRD